jgi:3-phenylpropionate/trans-cinnamate dioxygenase ferredoxin subunit
MGTWVKLTSVNALADNQVKTFTANGQSIALARIGNHYFAIEDLCTHDGGPLGEGTLVDQCVECPRHGARFDLRTGAAVTLPAVVPVKTFAVKTEGSDIYIQL